MQTADSLQRSVDAPVTKLHGRLRTATIIDMSVVALVAAGLVAWLLYKSANIEGAVAGFERSSYIGRGLVLLTAHVYFVHGIAASIIAIVLAAVLAVFMLHRKRWAYLMTGVGAAAMIVPLWLLRGHIFDIEAMFANSTRWAERSPYVQAATVLTIIATGVLAVLSALALATFFTARRTR